MLIVRSARAIAMLYYINVLSNERLTYLILCCCIDVLIPNTQTVVAAR